MGVTFSRHALETADRPRIAYRTGGPIDGSPVLLVHALAGRSETWDAVAGALVDRGKRVIMPDLRGHGRSGWARRYALADFEGDLVALLDHLQLPTIDLVGHSLGGHLALRLALRAPGRVRRMVIEEAPVPPRDAGD